MGLAAVFWISVLAFLVRFPFVSAETFVSAGFFVTLFVVSVTYYVRTSIRVDEAKVTYQGMLKSVELPFEAISKVQVMPGLITLYVVVGGRKSFHFTSFFTRHRELVQLVRERARLA